VSSKPGTGQSSTSKLYTFTGLSKTSISTFPIVFSSPVTTLNAA